MQLMLDTANLEDIRFYQDILPLAGVTTNPSIIKKEGKINFFHHLRQIREIIGLEQSLHVQVVSTDAETMMKEAHAILEQVDKDVYIKVPVSLAGLQVIKKLKAQGIHVTATAIYTKMQAYLAIAAGVDYLAPYYNRMENLNTDAAATIAAIAGEIAQTKSSAKILGASYKNVEQINRTLEAGGQAVTVNPDLLHQVLTLPSVLGAVEDFKTDWESVYGDGHTILDL